MEVMALFLIVKQFFAPGWVNVTESQKLCVDETRYIVIGKLTAPPASNFVEYCQIDIYSHLRSF